MTKPLPVIAGGYSVRINGLVGTRPISNTLAFLHAGMALDAIDDGPNAFALAASVATHWASFAGVALHTSYGGTDVVVYAMGSVLLPAATHANGATGGDTGTQAFSQICALIHEHVVRRGKGSQSRMFLSPISNDTMDVNGTTLDGAYQSAVIGNYDDMIAAIITDMVAFAPGTWSQVQISKKTFGGVYGRLFPIDGHTIEPKVSSQRRRLGR